MPDSPSLESQAVYDAEPPPKRGWTKDALIARLAPYQRFWPWAAGVLGVIVLVWAIWGRGEPAEPYRTAAVDRGEITRVVSATGALAPLVSVNVGSTVSGLVKTVEADFNSTVEAGQVLVRLEPETFQQRVAQAQATLSQAQAQYAVANADYGRYQILAQRGFASQQLMSQQRAARDSAAAGVSQARAALATVQIDLNRSVIRSPIRGVVVDRQINVGQSVAASFQAPTLFVIAQDLSRLQANITVDEADIGEVREGMPVRFTVDAFPDSEFEGRVSQVRQQGVDNTGVVSYTVVVQADNPRRQLLPGMTANAEIIIEQTENAMRLPNAALRFRPTDPALVARAQEMTSQSSAGGDERRQGGGQGQRQGGQGGQGGDRAGRGVARLTEQLQLTAAQQAQARTAYEQATAAAGQRPGGDAAPAERRAYQRRIRDAALRAIEPSLNAQQRQLLEAMRTAPAGERREVRRQAVVWVLRDNKLEPVRVELGVADDSYTVILGGDLRAGDQVVIGGGPQAEEDARGQGGGNRGRNQPANPLGGGGGMRIRGV
jgi:HlyD family secretion protein